MYTAITADIAAAVLATADAASLIDSTPVSTLGTCPTCLCYGGEPLPGDPAVEELATCPTCGVASVEWTMVVEMDALMDRMCRFEALGDALAELDEA